MIRVLAAKELRSLFLSPLAWTTLALLQLLLAWVFLNQVDAFLGLQPQLALLANPPGVTEMVVTPLFGAAALILLAVTPLLAMRLIAEERRNHTLPLLLSAPISLTSIVAGKFFGLWAFLCLVAALVTVMAASLFSGAPLDGGLLAANLAGLVMLAACYSALGLYFSSLTAHPALAAAAGLGASLGLWLLDIASRDLDGLRILSPLQHFSHLGAGVADTADAAYFVLFTLLFLLLTRTK